MPNCILCSFPDPEFDRSREELYDHLSRSNRLHVTVFARAEDRWRWWRRRKKTRPNRNDAGLEEESDLVSGTSSEACWKDNDPVMENFHC